MEMRDLKILCKKTIVFGLILFIFDLGLGEGLRFLYFRHPPGNRKNLIKVMEETMAPIMIFGSSRPQHHYISIRFEEAFGKKCFNSGEGGATIEYEETLLEAVLVRYSPSMIILDFNRNEFMKSNNPKGQFKILSRLLPYYRYHKEIRDNIKAQGFTERIKLISHIYPFNSEIIHQILWKRFAKSEGSDGYVPFYQVWNDPLQEQSQEDPKETVDAKAVRLFSDFIAKIKARNIRLFIIVSPIYEKFILETSSLSIAKEMCSKGKVPFYDFLENAEFLAHREYFRDPLHLNNEGAEVFTNLVIKEIKNQ